MSSVMCNWVLVDEQWRCDKCETVVPAKDGDDIPISLCPASAKSAGLQYRDAEKLLPTSESARKSAEIAHRSLILEGPGTELKKILSLIGIKTTKNCACESRASLMNIWGADICESRIGTIVQWLREEASTRGLPFFEPAARIVVKRAISNSRRRMKKKCQTTTDSPSTARSGSGGTAS